jgi:nucleoside-diphosphate-sugar epimerase
LWIVVGVSRYNNVTLLVFSVLLVRASTMNLKTVFFLAGLSQGLSLSITVFGGTGFTGSRVCKILVEKGATVSSISKSGAAPKWCNDEEWTKQVVWKSADLLSFSDEELDAVVGTPDSVVSCVGVIGTDPSKLLEGNGHANKAAFASAKRGGKLQRAAYVSVGSEVDACKENWVRNSNYMRELSV